MDVQYGSIEAVAAATSYTDASGAVMDYNSVGDAGAAGGYAQFGAKAAGGGSIGTRIWTILAGVRKKAIDIAASGLLITLLAGSTLAAQAVTTTSVTATNYGSFSGGGFPASGTSVEIKHDGTNGYILSYDRTGGAYKTMLYQASSHRFSQGSVTIDNGLTVSANGLSVVAGGANVTGNTTITSASASALLLTSSSLVGMTITRTGPGGQTWTMYIPNGNSGLYFDDGSARMAVSHSATAGDTDLLLWSVDLGALTRVKAGANGTGPGGVGRALYM